MSSNRLRTKTWDRGNRYWRKPVRQLWVPRRRRLLRSGCTFVCRIEVRIFFIVFFSSFCFFRLYENELSKKLKIPKALTNSFLFLNYELFNDSWSKDNGLLHRWSCWRDAWMTIVFKTRLILTVGKLLSWYGHSISFSLSLRDTATSFHFSSLLSCVQDKYYMARYRTKADILSICQFQVIIR